MRLTQADVLHLVRLNDAAARAELETYSTDELEQATEMLAGPIALSWSQRVAARLAGIDVEHERRRFQRLIDAVLADR